MIIIEDKTRYPNPNAEKQNPMRRIAVGKVILNMAAGGAADKIESAYALASQLTGKTPVRTRATRRARTFRVKRGAPIGIKVTLRKGAAVEFLKKVLPAVDNKIAATAFDNEGNFAFGIAEYLDIPGMKYDPALGILGMNIIVSLERPGWRIKRRKIAKQKIPGAHRISRQEAIEFARKQLGVNVVEKIE